MSSDYQFRYLGLWISMNLDWSKQRQVMTKTVMDWRWHALVAKVDPAQLKSTIIEWLLPRMEIGFLHANITEKMCNGWLSTIIHTLCYRSQMSTVHTINKKAFCLLAGIPDLWMRAQTTRATELFVNLNTQYCLSGETTRARFCSFMAMT